MATTTIKIRTVLGGLSPSQYYAGDGQYLGGVAIDPDLPISDSAGDVLPCGMIRPTSYASISGSNISGNPYWILNNPKNALTYVYANDGKVVSYSSALTLASEVLVSTLASAAGNGGVYYNNYLYFMTSTDIARYGPLNDTPAMTAGVWTGATLGSLTALTNTTYPSIFGSGVMPNHPGHVHPDNKLYFVDFKAGIGYVHYIKTQKGTYEGDTNSSSAYNALDLPFGFMPTDVESFGDLLVISAIQTTDGTVMQGNAVLFFWDTISSSFYNFVALPDPLVTAMKNVNGTLYIWSGPGFGKGYRLSKYAGGYATTTVHFSVDGSPPLAGAVDAFGDRVVWGTHQQLSTTTASTPEYYPCVMAYGSKDPRFPIGVHPIATTPVTGSASDGVVTALRFVEQASFAIPRVVMGYRNASGTAIAKRSTTYGTSIFRSPLITVGAQFTIKQIRIQLGAAVAANMTLTPTVFLDDFSSSKIGADPSVDGLKIINATTYPNNDRFVHMNTEVRGKGNFVLELRNSGTVLLPIMLPITIVLDVMDD